MTEKFVRSGPKSAFAPSKLSKMDLLFPSYCYKIIKIDSGFQLYMKGFKSKGRSIEWTRSFILKNGLVIKDYLDTDIDEKVNINFVFDKNIRLKPKGSTFYASNGNLKFDLTIGAKCSNHAIHYDKIDIYEGYLSKYYGDEDSCKILNVSFISNGPLSINTKYNYYG